MRDAQVIEEAIRGAAGRKHVSLSRLAKDAHVQRQTIYNWFDGVAPEPETWGRVAARLDLPPLADVLAPYHASQGADPMVAAIQAQTAALLDLVAEFRLARGVEQAEGLAMGKAAAQALLPPGDSGSRAKPPAPRETTGSGGR